LGTIGSYLLDKLYAKGVKHIFGVPGDYILRFDKLIEQHPIEYVNATRENTAGYMADTYGRINGLGVACITYGVGVNIANAMAQALVESSPMVVISGAAGAKELSHSSLLHHTINTDLKEGRDVTQMEIFRHVTVDRALINDPLTAQEQIDRVIDNCLRYKKPVYLEIPRDMVDKSVTLRSSLQSKTYPMDGDALNEALTEVSSLLKKCQSPVLWIGHEIQRYGLVDAVLQFAEKYNIPITTSLLGKSAISEYHPLFVGVYQGALSRPEVKEFVENCDMLIQLGVLLSDVNTGIFSAQFPQKYHISADANNITIGKHGYKGVGLSPFIQALADLKANLRFGSDFPANIDRPSTLSHHNSKSKMTSKYLFEALEKNLKHDHVIVTDIGDCLFGCTDLTVEQNAFFACAYFASLGFSVPAAITAQLLMPKKRVIALVGDGAFQMTSTELSTAVRYGIDPVIIVLNNHGYGTERPLIEGKFNDIVDWKYAELPKLLGGGKGLKVKTSDQFDEALKEALKTRGQFCLIEVELGKTDFSPAMQRFSELVAPRT
jgi:indolepyruvate decarboxylase